MLLAVLSVCSEEELDGDDSDSDEDARTLMSPDINARRQQIKNKIMAVGRMQRVFQLLREEAENATELAAGFPLPGLGVGTPGLGAEGVAGRSLDGECSSGRRGGDVVSMLMQCQVRMVPGRSWARRACQADWVARHT